MVAIYLKPVIRLIFGLDVCIRVDTGLLSPMVLYL